MRQLSKQEPPRNVRPDGQERQRFVDAEREYLEARQGQAERDYARRAGVTLRVLRTQVIGGITFARRFTATNGFRKAARQHADGSRGRASALPRPRFGP